MKNLIKLSRIALKEIKGGYEDPSGGGDPLCWSCSCSISGQEALWVLKTRSEAWELCSSICGELCEIPSLVACDPTKL